jgi:hypothetical protein
MSRLFQNCNSAALGGIALGLRGMLSRHKRANDAPAQNLRGVARVGFATRATHELYPIR